MRKKIWIISSLIIVFLISAYSSNIHSSIKKIYFFNSIKEYDKSIEILNTINLKNIKGSERKIVVDHLFRIADSLYKLNYYDISKEYYLKIVNEYPQYWYIYNKIELMNRKDGKGLLSIKNVIQQFSLMFRSFETIFILISVFFNGFFYATILVFFIFSIMLFVQYIELFTNDILITHQEKISYINLSFFILFIIWPIIFKFSWVIFPFIIFGFIWEYLEKKEKKNVVFIWILILISSFFFNFNIMLEKRFRSSDFKNIQMVFHQKTFDKETVENFSDELKTLQAYVYYINGDYNNALDILNLSSDAYTSKLKYDLLGCINYQFGNLNESLSFFNRSLEINDSDPITLNNFTLILLRESDDSILFSYEQRFPKIKSLKENVSNIMIPKIKKTFFWRTLFKFSPTGSFKLLQSIKLTIVNYFKNPILYYFLISLLYFFLFRFLIQRYGESVNCSKCNKILKKSKIHRSYNICDDCYQLFFLKDVIFLEAKSIKSRELAKKARKKYLIGMAISILIPGYIFYLKKKFNFFVFSLLIFYYFLVVTIVGHYVYTKLFSLSPMIINIMGVFTIGIYVLINIFSLIGDKDGS